MFKTVLKPSTHQIEVERSKFICHLFPAKTVEEAEVAVLAVRKEHYGATHNVPVYIVGDAYKHSDDGEPAGTAAAPVLSMLKSEGYDRICAVVTRYFGGTKLGTGGLVRAYTSAVKEALAHAAVSNIRTYSRFAVEIDYANLGSVEHYFKNAFEADANAVLHVADVQYAECVRFLVYLTPDAADRMHRSLADLTSGQAQIAELVPVLLTDRYEPYQL